MLPELRSTPVLWQGFAVARVYCAVCGQPAHDTQGIPSPTMSDREIDQQLVERVQRGDKQAFGLLVAKYQRKLARLLSRLIRDPAEVEDVAQETFIKAYKALPAFRGDSAFYTWLYRDKYRQEFSRFARPARTDHNGFRFRGGRDLRGCGSVEGQQHARASVDDQADRRHG